MSNKSSILVVDDDQDVPWVPVRRVIVGPADIAGQADRSCGSLQG